jgi:glyoxylase-like metal-dependent hydrolase (beta-lactamase superfamily II)
MVDRFRVGNVEVVAVLDMVPPPRHPSDFFPGVAEHLWEPYRDDVLDNGNIQLYYGHFFARSEGKVVMVDTGMGPGPHVTRGNITGNLMGELNAAGVQAGDVDIVVHTHLHMDHVGWNIDYTGDTPKPYFPNARYLVPRTDWEYFIQPEVLATAPYVADSVVPLQGMKLMDLIEEGHQVTGEITTLATPGHTPGHQVILISSQGEKAMIIGDAIHSKVQVQEPSWCAGVDTNKTDSHNSREMILNMAEQDNYIMAAGHFHPTEHVGRVVRLQGKRYWQVI